MARQSMIIVAVVLAAVAGGIGVWTYNQNRTVLDVNVGGQGFTVQQR